MRHITLLAVIASLLGGPVIGQYDSRYSEEVERQENKQATRHCQSCNPDECPEPTECVAGIVKDPCQCCHVCGKAEFELCDHPQVIQRRTQLCCCSRLLSSFFLVPLSKQNLHSSFSLELKV